MKSSIKEPKRFKGTLAEAMIAAGMGAQELADTLGISLTRADIILRHEGPPPHPAIVDLRPLGPPLKTSYTTICGMADNDRAAWWGVEVGKR